MRSVLITTERIDRLRRQGVVWILAAGLFLSCSHTRGEEPAGWPEALSPEQLPSGWSVPGEEGALPVTSSIFDLLDSGGMEDLVRTALENNPDLHATALRLQASGYLLGEAASSFYPGIGADFSSGRNNQGVDDVTGKRAVKNSFQAGMSVSWEVDLWGELADTHRALRSDLAAEAQLYRQLRDALAVQVIQNWIEAVTAREILLIEEERQTVLGRYEEILMGRYREGLGDREELSTARSRKAVALADHARQEARMNRSIRSLEVLLGRFPTGGLEISGGLPAVGLPGIAVPAEALLHRPDIQVSLGRLEAARSRDRAARKARLPNITLSAQVFKSSTDLSKLEPAALSWSILGSLFQPIFQGGQLFYQSKAKSSEAEAALYDLYGTVLKAAREVEDFLLTERELTDQLAALEIAYEESRRSARSYEEKYRRGLVSIQELLLVNEQEMSVKSRLQETRAALLINRTNLALAVGTGLQEE